VKSNPESPSSPEREEDLFDSYSAAEGEVETILKEISEILVRAQDRAEAERRLLETHANRLDQANRKARELLNRWLAHVRELADSE